MPQPDTPKPADEALLDKADAEMAALVRLIDEQPSHEYRIKAIVALCALWASIEGTFKAAIAAKEEALKIAGETKDLRAMGRLIKDTYRLEAALFEYRKRSERYVGELLAS